MVNAVAETLPHLARIYGDRVALIVHSRQIGFRELDTLSNQMAKDCQSRGGREPAEQHA
jgi:non-ribosomal peptide synthetase component E (peptide arylation enzyme)